MNVEVMSVSNGVVHIKYNGAGGQKWPKGAIFACDLSKGRVKKCPKSVMCALPQSSQDEEDDGESDRSRPYSRSSDAKHRHLYTVK